MSIIKNLINHIQIMEEYDIINTNEHMERYQRQHTYRGAVMTRLCTIFTYFVLISPIAAFLFYTIADILKVGLYEKLGNKSIKMIYYLFMLIWSVAVFALYRKEILSINIFKEYVINKELLNAMLYFAAVLLFTLIWDTLFISCKSISSLRYKDTEITLEEAQNIGKMTIAKEQDIKFLVDILKIKYMMICDMEEYANSLETFDENMYIKLMKKYSNLRKAKRFEYFSYNEEGLEEFRRRYKYSEAEFSKVMYNLDLNGVCVPESKDESIFYAIIKTEYSDYDFIITLHSGTILFDEHKIIQNIITVLDLYITIKCKDLEIADLKNENCKIVSYNV